eukprot:jgi/Botrbrau1/1787/Bobra.0217s0042.1
MSLSNAGRNLLFKYFCFEGSFSLRDFPRCRSAVAALAQQDPHLQRQFTTATRSEENSQGPHEESVQANSSNELTRARGAFNAQMRDLRRKWAEDHQRKVAARDATIGARKARQLALRKLKEKGQREGTGGARSYACRTDRSSCGGPQSKGCCICRMERGLSHLSMRPCTERGRNNCCRRAAPGYGRRRWMIASGRLWRTRSPCTWRTNPSRPPRSRA